MRLLRHLHDGARNILGESLYGKLSSSARRSSLVRKFALAEFEARDPGPKGLDLVRLDEVDRATVLALGVHYSYASSVEGDVAEFGTATGLSARAIARGMASQERGRTLKNLHLFDSFDGLPEPSLEIDKNSFEFKTGVWKAGEPKLLTADELLRSCERILPRQTIFVHAGWFKDTVVKLSPSQRFSFVHFDGDLYESTFDAFDGLFGRGQISNGAMIAFNGFNAGKSDPDRGERAAWKALTAKYAVDYSFWRAYGNLGMCFIVHSYNRS
jgi:hypothetical protein